MAIALDTTSGNNGSAGTTVTFSHTCTGTDLMLVVFVAVQSGTPSVTYNGVSMTQVAVESSGNPLTYMFVLENPATGAHDVVVTKGSGVQTGANAISFTGAQSYDDTSTAAGNSTSASCTVQTNRSSGYTVVGVVATNPSSLTYTGSGTAFGARQQNTANPNLMACAYQSFSGGSDNTETWTLGVSREWSMCGIEIYQVPASFKPVSVQF